MKELQQRERALELDVRQQQKERDAAFREAEKLKEALEEVEERRLEAAEELQEREGQSLQVPPPPFPTHDGPPTHNNGHARHAHTRATGQGRASEGLPRLRSNPPVCGVCVVRWARLLVGEPRRSFPG